MLNRILEVLTPVAGVMFCLAGAVVISASGEPTSEPETQPTSVPATVASQSYIGTDRCITCHRVQANTWAETVHAQAFEHLPTKYRDDPSCLKCHLTAFGEPGGYLPGMTAELAQPFQSVGCEACHGPGAVHEEAVKLWTLSDPADEERLLEEMKAAIIKTPTDSHCAVCHSTQAHQSHPPYDGQPLRSANAAHPGAHSTTAAEVTFPPTPHSYSVKTCGSCHYSQYQQWRIETHADLTAGLTAQYANDPECLKCHTKLGDTSEWYTPSTSPQANAHPLGVGCESCHGSGIEHVLFNKQYISGLRLESETVQAARESIRQGKPANACLQCHIREGHQEHPEFEKPNFP